MATNNTQIIAAHQLSPRSRRALLRARQRGIVSDEYVARLTAPAQRGFFRRLADLIALPRGGQQTA